MKLTNVCIREKSLAMLRDISRHRKKKVLPNRTQIDILDELIAKLHKKECSEPSDKL